MANTLWNIHRCILRPSQPTVMYTKYPPGTQRLRGPLTMTDMSTADMPAAGRMTREP